MLVLTAKNSKISFTSSSKNIIPMWFPTQTLTSWKLQITIPILIINRYLSYPLVNVYITNWKIIMSSSWVNQLINYFDWAMASSSQTVNVIKPDGIFPLVVSPPWIPSSSMLGEAITIWKKPRWHDFSNPHFLGENGWPAQFSMDWLKGNFTGKPHI